MKKRYLNLKNRLNFLNFMKVYYETIFPTDQLFHCLKGKVDDVVKIKPFIDAMINDNDYEIKCTGSDANRNSLRKLVNYYISNIYPNVP